MKKKYWENGVNEIIASVLNGKRTIQQAKFYMEQKYVGDNRRSFNHAAFEATSDDITAELTVYNLLKDAIKLGHGNDTSLDCVFR
ncbi:hypothetical protein EDM57_05025 [Brevibacillus gelatini]|uniref:Uncharacterized protein n=1 Tax=Brevibacillus gelatini TaxID=1655277 RepID=A0A3M8B9K7_9BACL|nr:hypothetical protein [Brevibacillus gelatini]RNB59505.1 hypothetical protein EDM57_05025 [Brevibacillus gelatini]